MLSHDVTLNRVFRRPVNVNDTPSADLERIGVEQLFRVTKLCEKYRATLFVEIKRESYARFGDEGVSSIITQANGYVFISFSLDAILHARRAHGERIGWVVPDLSDHTREICDAIQPDYLICDQKLIPRGGKLWPAQWMSYEVPTKAMAEQLSECGVSLFETKNVKGLMC